MSLTIAVPKGRVLEELGAKLAKAGVPPSVFALDDRSLTRQVPELGIRLLLLKPDDVPTYVEYGAADVGIAGKDILRERDYDLYTLGDLGIGKCKMITAGLPGFVRPQSPLRVATKYLNCAKRFYASKGEQVELIYVQGSVELAPVTGLSDVIVDLVQSGATLRDNGLVMYDVIDEVSSVVVANRASLKLKREALMNFVSGLLQT